MNELDKLRPEVQEAVAGIDAASEGYEPGDECTVRVDDCRAIRAELLRLADENAQLRDVLADRDMDREMAAHANKELAALKARFAEAPVTYVARTTRPAVIADAPKDWRGRRVHLVVEE